MSERIGRLPPEGLRVGGVILTGDSERGTKARRDLELAFTAEGIRVQAREGPGTSLLPWSGLDAVTCTEEVVLPDGRGATVLELTSEGQSIRFLLPADHVNPRQAAYLGEAAPVWLAAYKWTEAPTPPVTAGAPAAAEAWLPSTRPDPPAPPRLDPPAAPPPPPAPPTPSDEWLPVSPPPKTGPVPGNGAAGPWVPEPTARLPQGPVPSEVGLAADPGPTLFTVRTTDAQPGWGSHAMEVTAPVLGANLGRRATDWPGEVGPPSPPSPPPPPDPGTAAGGEATTRPRRGVKVLLVIALLVAGAGGYLIYRNVVRAKVPAATAADVARASSINLRLGDLPAGWSENVPTPDVPPPATTARRLKALGTMASCLGQPLSSVRGWFGYGSFPQQITVVRSPTFGEETVPTAEMYSQTALVVASGGTSTSLGAALGSPKFPACFGQYQVAAVSVPATGQVQMVPLTAPPGVKAFGFMTTFSLADGTSAIVGDAFMVGTGVLSLLQATTDGPSLSPTYFQPAFRAVAQRVAVASQ